MRTDVAIPRLQRPDGRPEPCPGTSGPATLANAPPACGHWAGSGARRVCRIHTTRRPLSRGRGPREKMAPCPPACGRLAGPGSSRADGAPPGGRLAGPGSSRANGAPPGGRLAGPGPRACRAAWPPTTWWPLGRGRAHPGVTASRNRPPACGRQRTGPTDRQPRGPAPGAAPSTSSSGGGTGVQGGRRPSRSDATAGSALDARPGAAIITNRAAPFPHDSPPGAGLPSRTTRPRARVCLPARLAPGRGSVLPARPAPGHDAPPAPPATCSAGPAPL